MDCVGVIPLMGEASVLQRIETNQLRLNMMIQDMNKQFQVEQIAQSRAAKEPSEL